MSFNDDIEKELISIIELAMPSVRQQIMLPKVPTDKQEDRIKDFIATTRLIILYQLFDRESAEREFQKRLRWKKDGEI